MTTASVRLDRRCRTPAIAAFERDPNAVAKIADDAEDVDVLLEYFKYPAEHWVRLRTTNPVESTFATERL